MKISSATMETSWRNKIAIAGLILSILGVSANAAAGMNKACKGLSNNDRSCGPRGNSMCMENKKKGGLCGAGLSRCRPDECCGQYGICGTGEECNVLCQCALSGLKSKCNGKMIPQDKLPIVGLASVCGADIGRCPDGYCCSGFGFCTNNSAICTGPGPCSQAASGKGSDCKPTPPPKTHYYTMDLTWGKKHIAGVERYIILNNGKYPGPTIEVDEGDRIVVTVHNNLEPNKMVNITGLYDPLTTKQTGAVYPRMETLGDDTNVEVSVHWHGMIQRNTVIMDGVAEVTQQAIKSGKSQVFSFIADLTGPFWYHSHFKAQYLDGLRGTIMVHSLSKKKILNSPLPLLISDWNYNPSMPILENWMRNKGGNSPNSAVIDEYGQGSCKGLDCEYKVVKAVKSPLECTLETATNLLRFTNGGGVDRIAITIDEHVMSIVALDGVDIVPSNVTNIIALSSGQRISALICPNNTAVKARADAGASFWIRADGWASTGGAFSLTTTVLGVLAYNDQQQSGKLSKLPNSTKWDSSNGLNISRIIDLINDISDDNYINQPISKAAPPPADVNYTLTVVRPLQPNSPQNFNSFGFRVDNGTDISFARDPHAPSLLVKDMQGNPVPNAMNGEGVVNGTQGGMGANTITVKAGQVVQLIINNPNGPHPMHLHGHWMWVMQRAPTNAGNFNPATAKFDETPLLRDTSEVRGVSNLVVRFVADNPGMWIIHCHIDWHLVGGMGVVINYAPAGKN